MTQRRGTTGRAKRRMVWVTTGNRVSVAGTRVSQNILGLLTSVYGALPGDWTVTRMICRFRAGKTATASGTNTVCIGIIPVTD